VQKWYLLVLKKGGIESINFHTNGKPEFRNWKWTTMKKLTKRVVPFKREVYKKVHAAFHNFLKQ
jgi:putative (di)nucleoside polyphosphate hydrolase